MKLPELPKRKPKTAASSRGIKAPAFVEDLYKDMRDRRLIIPAVVLLIAIIAVPMFLSESADTSVRVPPPVQDPNAVRVEPAVLAVQEVGVRDFRERLDALNRKNPFGGRFDPEQPESETAGDLTDPEALTDPEPVPGTDGTSVTDPADTGTAPADSTPTSPPEPEEPPEPFVLVPRVNVVVGVADRDRRQTIENVKSGDLLPSKDVPAAMFLGNSEDSEYAELLVSRDVEKVRGEGKCRPKDQCEFLRLTQGDSAYLTFADGKRYLIKVTEIYFERVDEDQFNQSD